jgi:ribosomal protein S18 acetylase RimI-like enzyme
LNVEIFGIDDPASIANEKLVERALQCKMPHSRQFVVQVDGVDSAFLSFDYLESIRTGVIYEIFVLPEYRDMGIGEQLRLFAEDLARGLNCMSIVLSPVPLDETTKKNHLVSWYEKRGYRKCEEIPDQMEKKLSKK